MLFQYWASVADAGPILKQHLGVSLVSLLGRIREMCCKTAWIARFVYMGKSTFSNMAVTQSDFNPKVREMSFYINDVAENELSIRACS